MSRHARSRPVRRGLNPPVNKAPILLVAALVGALVAALPAGMGAADPAPTAATIAALAGPDAVGSIGVGSDAGVPPGDDGANGARKVLTAAEAAARLEVLAEDRARREASERASREAARREALRPDWALPLAGRLTSCYCMRWGSMHAGIDIAAPMLTPIHAAGDGVVVESGPASGYGNVIKIAHENGDVTLYGHMEQLLVSAGDIVAAGQRIALNGSRGFSTGPHLHFEVHRGSGTVDPVPWLAANGTSL